MVGQEKREVAGWWFWILGLLVISSVVLSVLGYVGAFTSTVVERKVFENSYQRSEGLKQEVAIFEAQLAEISNQLTDAGLDDGVKTNLRAQAAAIRVRLNAARGQQ